MKLRKRARDNVPLLPPASFERSTILGPNNSTRDPTDGLESCETNERVRDGGTPGDRTLKNVGNLSDFALTPDEQTLLSRGLQFYPKTGQFTEFSLLQDLDNFARNLRLREYFRGRPEMSQSLY
ncbi:hypothetical protein ISCGN_025419 [Ixodes scapularis]